MDNSIQIPLMAAECQESISNGPSAGCYKQKQNDRGMILPAIPMSESLRIYFFVCDKNLELIKNIYIKYKKLRIPESAGRTLVQKKQQWTSAILCISHAMQSCYHCGDNSLHGYITHCHLPAMVMLYVQFRGVGGRNRSYHILEHCHGSGHKEWQKCNRVEGRIFF